MKQCEQILQFSPIFAPGKTTQYCQILVLSGIFWHKQSHNGCIIFLLYISGKPHILGYSLPPYTLQTPGPYKLHQRRNHPSPSIDPASQVNLDKADSRRKNVSLSHHQALLEKNRMRQQSTALTHDAHATRELLHQEHHKGNRPASRQRARSFRSPPRKCFPSGHYDACPVLLPNNRTRYIFPLLFKVKNSS